MHNSSSVIIAVERLEGLGEKSEGVFTGPHWFECN